MSLNDQSCVPCEIGAPTLTPKEIERNLNEVTSWVKENGPDKITKEFEFKDFMEALNFINKVGNLSESQGHHPNIYLHDYKKVRIELWTHKINGLHRNDFILAAKIDNI